MLPALDPTERHILAALTQRRGQVVPVADLIPPAKWGAPDPRNRRRVFKVRLGRLEWISILAMTLGMIALIGSLDPRPGNETNVNDITYILAGGATVATIAVLVLGSLALSPVRKTACLGALALRPALRSLPRRPCTGPPARADRSPRHAGASPSL